MVIPLSGILTYTKYMLVYVTYHNSHIFYVSDTSIIWKFTRKTIHIEHIYIQNTIQNNNIITQTFILSYNVQHLLIDATILFDNFTYVYLVFCLCFIYKMPLYSLFYILKELLDVRFKRK